jgi:hypothetical protein
MPCTRCTALAAQVGQHRDARRVTALVSNSVEFGGIKIGILIPLFPVLAPPWKRLERWPCRASGGAHDCLTIAPLP